MQITSVSQAQTLGCNQGKYDGSHHQSSLVVLDFGAQAPDGSGTWGYPANFTTAQIESIAEAFADQYYACTGSNYNVYLNLALGTNDSPPAFGNTSFNSTVYNSLGRDWANTVSAVISYLKSDGSAYQVYTWGASDIESWCNTDVNRNPPNLCTPSSDATAWVQGYSSINPGPFDNFGSADGCPYSSYNNAVCPPPSGFSSTYDYHQSDYYYSWGAPPAQVTPEIYGLNSQSLTVGGDQSVW